MGMSHFNQGAAAFIHCDVSSISLGSTIVTICCSKVFALPLEAFEKVVILLLVLQQ